MRGDLLKSSSFRLAVIHALLFAGSVLVLFGFLYWATAGTMQRQAEATIEAEIQGLAEQYQRSGLAGLSLTITERLARSRNDVSVYLLTDASFRPLLGNLESWPVPVAPAETADRGPRWLEFRLGEGGHPVRARHFELRGGKFHLLVGRDVHELEATRQLVLRALLAGFGLTALLALAGGVLMSRSGLRRIEAINQTSRQVMAGDLSRRVPVRGSGDDLDQLATNLNAMLDKIESLMDDVRRVSDNIAHDLRTPLARLRTRLETLQREGAAVGGRQDEQEKVAVRLALNDIDGMMATFNALLRIARIESGSHRSALDSVDLSALVHDVIELYEPLAEDAGLRLESDLPDGISIRGDKNLLFQAIGNVLDNAVKYSPPGGHISVGVGAKDGRARIEIRDGGPGIPVALREKVLQRFYRGDWSRSTSGSGLGLSLVAAVCDFHEAKLALGDADPGLKVSMELPLAST